MTETKPFTAAQLKTNHERTAKAVERLNEKAWAGIKYEAVLEEGKLGVIVKYTKPAFGAEAYKAPFTEAFRYETRVDQTIGWPVSYDNKYNASNHGTICKGINDAEETRSRRFDALRRYENEATRLEAELAAVQDQIARIKAELGQ